MQVSPDMIVTKMAVLAWVVSLLMAMQPPKRLQHSYIPEAKETIEQTEARYQEIAAHYLSVAFDKSEAPLFGGNQARLRSLTLALAIAYFESGFRRDVHLGRGKYARGDGGRSWCLMQINIGKGTVPDVDPIVSTWHGTDLVSETSKCARAGYHIMRRAMSACASLPWQDRLSSYTSGSCQSGEAKARARMRFGVKSFDRNKPKFTDSDVWAALAEPDTDSLAKAAQDGLTRPGPAMTEEQAMQNLRSSFREYLELWESVRTE